MESIYRSAIKNLSTGGFRYYRTIGSTNDEAHEWVSNNAPDFSLIIADEQTSGRGRMNRKWYTPPNSALAMSLILRPTKVEELHPTHATGLLAIALTETLQTLELSPKIKWPNDVLLAGRKVAGILVESHWTDGKLEALILGMGVNVRKASVPPENQLSFPATCIEKELGFVIERVELLKGILSNVRKWRPKLGKQDFIEEMETNLAYLGNQVQVQNSNGKSIAGKILGLEPDGSLLLEDTDGKSFCMHFGEVHLRPLA